MYSLCEHYAFHLEAKMPKMDSGSERGQVGGGFHRQDSGPVHKPCQNHFYFQSSHIYQIQPLQVLVLFVHHMAECIKNNKNDYLQLPDKPLLISEIKSGAG